jgi:predicted nucleotidyltransferase component of viral defense system
MKPLRLKIQEHAQRKLVPQTVIEKDYALSYLLAGISEHSVLSDSLIFKGGTALKKIYFGDYRFSEDLDFSTINAPTGKNLEQAFEEVALISKKLLNQYGPFEINFKRNSEREPHPNGQDAFNFYLKFPWHPGPLCRVKVEVTHDEPVILLPIKKPILHDYEECINFQMNCYSIEEIIAEKLRALLQTHQKLILRGWNRPRARDYYDLWCLFKKYQPHINTSEVLETLDKKCLHRNVNYQFVEDFFTPELLQEARMHWQETLRVLVRNLPDCHQVLDRHRFFAG